MNISKLDKDQSTAMVQALIRDKALPCDLLEQIQTKTGGVPLFVEELTKSVIQSHEVKAVGDRHEFTGTTRSVSLPNSLRDSLMARLDRYAAIKERR